MSETHLKRIFPRLKIFKGSKIFVSKNVILTLNVNKKNINIFFLKKKKYERLRAKHRETKEKRIILRIRKG